MTKDGWRTVLINAAGIVLGALLLVLAGALGSSLTDGSLLRLLGAVDIQTGNHVVSTVPVPPPPGSPALTDSQRLRTYSGSVNFPRAFSRPPTVTLAMNRLVARPIPIVSVQLQGRPTTTGFDYEIHTWMESHIFSVGVTWVAVAP